ncbi:MAG: carbohydrate-binding protein [Bacteroidales bacterium]|nr:carbohydrate-binding protein [Bacteroidales bacterium]
MRRFSPLKIKSLKTLKYFLFLLALSLSTRAFTQLGSGKIYTIQSKAAAKVIDVKDASLANDANVGVWTNTGSDALSWIADSVGVGKFTFTNVASGKLLHVASETLADSVNVNQSDNTGNNTVVWTIVNRGSGEYTIHNAIDTNYVLCVATGTIVDGTNIVVAKNQLSDKQLWTFQEKNQQDIPPTSTITEEVFDAWINKSYYADAHGGHFYGEEPNWAYWGVVEQMEIILDAYETTRNDKYKTLFEEAWAGFIHDKGATWTWNEFNDDIMWAVLMCSRAYFLFGNKIYLDKATLHFNSVYNRAWNETFLDGGLWWKYPANDTKNACINGPAAVAACYLGLATGNKVYYDKAIKIYEWQRSHLYVSSGGEAGKVYDAWNKKNEKNTWSSTYNQGTYLGAAVLLYNYTHFEKYLKDATNIAHFTRHNMFNNGVMNSEDWEGLRGFKGIFMRYLRMFITDLNRPDYIEWMNLNAKVAYNNRNSNGLIRTAWATRTDESGEYENFDLSCAASLMVNFPVVSNTLKDAYQKIEAENYDHFLGVVKENCVEGTQNLTGIQEGDYSAYHNIEFGIFGPDSIHLRLSGITNDNYIEIRLNSPTGEIISTIDVPNTGSWEVFADVKSAVPNLQGIQNLYFVYKGSDPVCKINYFKFTENEYGAKSNGLYAEYFNGVEFNYPACNRIDNIISFNWGSGSPAGMVNNDKYSVRWTGFIEPLYSEEYTFFITSDNGRRLWINDSLIIDKWVNDWDIEYSGKITLEAGKKYNIKIEYFEFDGGANIKLQWSSASQAKQIIPASQLTPGERFTLNGPTDITLSQNTLSANQAAMTFIGTFSTIDEDADDTFSYILDNSTGDAALQNDLFIIKMDSLFANFSADYETQKSYKILVKTTDSQRLSYSKNFGISIINETGVNERTLSTDKLVLYPNPAADHVTIDNISKSNILSISIFTLSGQLINKQKIENFNEGSISISTQNLKTGYYNIVVSDDNNTIVHKLLIQ